MEISDTAYKTEGDMALAALTVIWLNSKKRQKL
jgi:hypothetical protein